MKYVRRVLLPGENIVYETGLHWLVYSRAILLLILAVAIFIGSLQVEQQFQIFIQIFAGVVLVIALFDALGAAIRRLSTELAVTDQRVIFKHGILARHTIEINRSKVESVDVDQSIFGRLFGYGTVLVRGTGGSLEPFQKIDDPITFRTHITAEPVLHKPASPA
jgi:uncharacterized membrane protein YdbT with pleckstrin-like domain